MRLRGERDLERELQCSQEDRGDSSVVGLGKGIGGLLLPGDVPAQQLLGERKDPHAKCKLSRRGGEVQGRAA